MLRPFRVSRAVARALTCGVLAAAGIGQTAHAQSEPISGERRGLTVSLGTGAGIGHRACFDCPTNRKTGATGYARLGYALGSHITVGAEVDGYRNTDITKLRTIVTFAYTTAYLQWYPMRDNGFFVKLHAGAENTRVVIDEPLQSRRNSTASGSAFGVSTGHDLRVSTNTSFTPFFSLFSTRNAEGYRAGRSIGPMNAYLFQMGLGLTRH